MTNRTVKTTLIAQVDGYLDGMNKAAAKTKELGTEAEKLAQKKQAFQQLGQAGLAVGALAAAGVALAVAKFADFDAAMSNVKAATQETSENMGLLREAALQAGADSVFSATESANAIEELGKAGLSTADILSGALKGSLDLASAGELGIARAAEVAATTLSQFNLAGDETARVADVLAAAAGKSLGSVDDLANGLKFVGPVASAMGVSLEETAGVLALFAKQGIIGEQAGTSLRGMLSSLTSPSQIASKEIERLGISLYDSEGGFLGIENAAGQLETAFKGMTDEQRNFSLGVLFGNEQITSARVLLDAGAEGVRKWTNDVDDAGYAAQVAADRLDNLQGDVEQLGGSLETALIGAGSASNDVLRFLAQSATEAINGFNELDPAAQGAALGLGGIVAAGGLTVGTIFTLVPKIAEFNAALKVMGPRAELAGKAAGGLAKGLGAITAAAAVVAVLDKIAASGQDAAAGVEEVANAVVKRDLDKAFEGVGSSVEDVDGALQKLFANDPASAFNRFGQEVFSFLNLSSSLTESKEGFDTLGQSLADLVNSGATGTAERAFYQIVAAAKEQGISITEVMDLMPAYREALSAQETDALLAADAADKNADALAVMAEDSSRAADELDALTEALKTFNGQQFAADDALFALKQSFLDIDEVIGADGFTGTLDLNTEEGIKNSQALRDIAAATNAAAGESLLLTGNQEDANAILEEGRAKLGEVGAAFGLTGDELQGFIDKYVSSPKDLAYEAILNGVGTMEQQLTTFVRNWEGKDVTVDFFANTYNLERKVAAVTAARYTGQALAYAANNANGGMYSYSSGGFGEGMYSGGTPLYKFAEPETRWEAFISGRPGAEARNREIWKDAGARLGMGAASSGPTSVSLNGARMTLEVDGRQISAVIRDQIVQADQYGRSTIENGKKGLV